MSAMMSFKTPLTSALTRSLTRREPINGMMCRWMRLVSVTMVVTFFRTSALTEHEARRQVLEIEFAQLLDGYRLMIELPFLGRIIALRHPTQLDPGFLSRELWRPYAMKTDGVATRASGRAVLNEVAALTRHEHAQAKPGKFVVPDDIVPALRLGGLDNAFGELSHGIFPVRNPSPA